MQQNLTTLSPSLLSEVVDHVIKFVPSSTHEGFGKPLQKIQMQLTKVTSDSSEFTKTIQKLSDTLSLMFVKSRDTEQVALYRLLPALLFQEVVARILTNWHGAETLAAVGLTLQLTDGHTFAILRFLQAQRETINADIAQACSEAATGSALFSALARCLDSQPYVSEILNFGPIFAKELPEDATIMFLRQSVDPDYKAQFSQSQLEALQTLRLNRIEQAAAWRRTQDQLLANVDISGLLNPEAQIFFNKPERDDVVHTEYLHQKVEAVLGQIERTSFGHFAVSGPSGSGKMSFVKAARQLYQDKMNVTENQSFIVVTLEATFDSKNLVGTYVCNEAGDFVFKKGPLTVAAEQGLWLVLRNIEDTPSDLLSFLMPLIEQNELQVTSTFKIRPKLGFRIFTLLGESQTHQHEDIAPLLSLLHLTKLDALATRSDLDTILHAKNENLFHRMLLPEKTYTIHSLLQQAISFLQTTLNLHRPHMLDFKPQTVNQMFQLYSRVSKHDAFSRPYDKLSQATRQLIIEEVVDVYLGYLYDKQLKCRFVQDLVKQVFNMDGESVLDAQVVAEHCTDMGREYGVSNETCFFGRATLPRISFDEELSQKFVCTGRTVRLLEQIAMGIKQNEALLLVGETGTGKTTAVQEIAKLLGKKLHVFNMNQNTDSADLLGGFKPVDLKYLLVPVYQKFLEVFNTHLDTMTKNNQKFLDLTQKCFEQNKVNEFIQCLNHGMKSLRSRPEIKKEVTYLDKVILDLQKRAQKLESGGGFVFQFVEGTLIQSIKNGDWVLLDEVNLASETVLHKLSTLVQGNHILLNERADVVETQMHPDFRVFMCMNPPYTSAGKKQLPQSLRGKLAEIYVPELECQADLWEIIDKVTTGQSCLREEEKRNILQFYITTKTEVAKQTKRGNIGLRNLCRALHFMKAAITLNYPNQKAIHDSLLTCFASHLEPALQEIIKKLIFSLFKIKKLPELALSSEGQDVRFAYIQGCLIPKGPCPSVNFDEKNFILTNQFKYLLRQLASVVSVSDYAVILEGPTSAGKTSCVQYLAAVTHHKVIRINNHMHTDVQEYLGSYAPDAATGKLVFQEGVLVEAVRNGYWVILDELNLAPSEVLEALNRLLDDNRELHIVETQKVVKAHPRFRIFATQNPTEGYGGRKELSEAFKNRFVLIKVTDVPTEELKQILVEKCELPMSRAVLMVKVMENLQIYRSQSNLFAGKDSIITVRDLLKWASRINQNSDQDDHVSQDAIALDGFLVLGERARDPADKLFIKQAIEKVFGVQLNIEGFYEKYFNDNLKTVFDSFKGSGMNKIIQSKQLKRLACLVAKCLQNKEPVLLVGDTGCGKTTLCQVFAEAITKQTLFSINCHQNTETSDFIGCMRTRKNLKQTQDDLLNLLTASIGHLGLSDQEKSDFLQQKSLKKRVTLALKQLKTTNSDLFQKVTTLWEDLSCVFEWHDGILVESMTQGGLLLIDEISLANDSVLERLNSVFEYDRTLVLTEKSSSEAVKIVAHPDFNMVATMNPSGDFGKKELSPALRNRMTEIWVESYFLQNELVCLYEKQTIPHIHSLNLEIDLSLIVKELCVASLGKVFCDSKTVENVATGIFNIIGFVNFTLGRKYFAMQRKSLSIRDILNLIDFLVINCSQATSSNAVLLSNGPLLVKFAFKQAVELVIIDGVCLGIDVAGESEKNNILFDLQDYLNSLTRTLLPQSVESDLPTVLVNTDQEIGVTPYILSKTSLQCVQNEYAFQAETTKQNLHKLLRALSLRKPILIEGAPGVGKTSLVEQLARQSGRKLVRVNLSEQTDMMDLLGSEYPVQAGDDDQDIQFRWCDGVLLQAIREGHWFLIDEMNLAQQSILEGLNAILDHRRTVYIPELNQEFKCHPDFFVFACQNPSMSATSTSGRKTLPKSFLNRFAKIYLEELHESDYAEILKHQASDLFRDPSAIQNLLNAMKRIEKLQCASESEAMVNMRDLSRFLSLYRTSQHPDHEQRLLQALETGYLLNFSSLAHMREGFLVAFQEGLVGNHKNPAQLFPATSLIRPKEDGSVCFLGLAESLVRPKEVLTKTKLTFADFQNLKGPQAKQLQGLQDCLRANLPVLILTDNAAKLNRSLQMLAQINGQRLRRILLNDKSDTTQLLGCFEQTSQDLSALINTIFSRKQNTRELLGPVADLASALGHCTDKQRASVLDKFITEHPNHFGDLKARLRQYKQGHSRFEWVDSVLVQAICEGHIAVFENANLCNPSVLDRLNSLLEDGNRSLSINEQGLVTNEATDEHYLREIASHKNFRSIFVMTKKTFYDQGKDVSRALRNRCLQIQVLFGDENQDDSLASGTVLDDTSRESFNFCLQKAQIEHDLMPAFQVQQEAIQAQKHLGKRSRAETKAQLSEQRLVLQGNRYLFAVVASKFFQPSTYCSHIEKTQHGVLDKNLLQALRKGQSFLEYSASCLQTEVSSSREVDESLTLKPLVQKLSQTNFSNNLLVLLQGLKHPSQLTHDPYLIYLASKVLDSSDLTQVEDDLKFIIETFDLEISLKGLKQNELSRESLAQLAQLNSKLTYLNIVENAQFYSHKQPLKDILEIATHNKYLFALRQLLLNGHHTVLCLNLEKELIKSEQEIVMFLERSLDEETHLLDLPNLIVIPKENDTVCIASQSQLYSTLTFIKDWIWLQKSSKKTSVHFRASTIPAVVSMLRNDAEVLAKQVVLQTSAFKESQFDLDVIDKVLTDQERVSLRDLPAYLACAHSLLFKLRRVPAFWAKQEQEFDEMVARREALVQKQASADTWLYHQKGRKNVADLQQYLEHCFSFVAESQIATKAIANVSQSLVLLHALEVENTIKALFVLPLELKRQEQVISIEWEEIQTKRDFVQYHYNDSREVDRQISSVVQDIEEMIGKYNRLQRLDLDSDGAELNLQNLQDKGDSKQEKEKALSQKQLKSLLYFVQNLISEVSKLEDLSFNIQKRPYDVQFACTHLQKVLYKGFEQFFGHFNHVLIDLFTAIQLFTQNMRTLALLSDLHQTRSKKQSQLAVFEDVVCLSDPTKTIDTAQAQHASKALYERQLLFCFKFQRITDQQSGFEKPVLEYFVRREISKRMQAEAALLDEQIFYVPFKVREQEIPDVVGKAMDEWTKEDVAKMDAAAEQEIEKNFPSYFDELQTTFFSGQYKKDLFEQRCYEREVSIEEVFSELLLLTRETEPNYKTDLLRDRLEVVHGCLHQDSLKTLQRKHRATGHLVAGDFPADLEWVDDLCGFLSNSLQASTGKVSMNITDVQFSKSFNFYHNPLPDELKLIYEPLVKLLKRLKEILDEYDNPLINDALFLVNYMLTTLNAERTPLMKLLTSLEFLLQKLEEWEDTYASKRLNSVEDHINTMKLMIIRYRKVQILSWRNLLSWRKQNLIKEDFDNYIRLTHTLEKQIFDESSYKIAKVTERDKRIYGESGKSRREKEENERLQTDLKIFELLDLFMRSSFLGVYESRLNFIATLSTYFACKTPKSWQKDRYNKVMNILAFVYNYYSQFKEKLGQTIERLDSAAREKVKTLVDVRKWTVQKFKVVKNNIDKTHRQLNRACKTEEEALIQNVQKLVLESTRKKFVQEDQLLSLDAEVPKIVKEVLPVATKSLDAFPLVKQLEFLEQTRIFACWPDATSISQSMTGFFERLQEVRAINKKHIQKRAYFDLLKFLKDNGMRSNFREDLQPLLMKSEIQKLDSGTYFFKAYQTFIMLQGASCQGEQSDIQNPDVLRMQGFSHSLLFKTLEVNGTLAELSGLRQALKTAVTEVRPPLENGPYLLLTQETLSSLQRSVVDFKSIVNILITKLRFQALLAETPKRYDLQSVSEKLAEQIARIPQNFFGAKVKECLQGVASESLKLLKDVPTLTAREQGIITKASVVIEGHKEIFEQLLEGESLLENAALLRRTQLVEKTVKVFYQDLLKVIKDHEERPEVVRKLSTSAEGDDTTPIADQPDLTIEQQGNFTKELLEVCKNHLPRLSELATSLFALKGVAEPVTGNQLQLASALLQKVLGCLQFAADTQVTAMNSYAKLSYLTQRVFLYLIFQGFCGQEDPDDSEAEPPEGLEQDGMGMGDGDGGKENITDQIEHEEQLEGLKNYESEEEKNEEEKDEKDDKNSQEEDNDFEMKEDFDGEMEDKEQDPEKPEDSEKEEDELDKVDDLLDNQLWNQNMEDMEEKERENDEKEEQKKDEVDLGDKDLDEQNQTGKDKKQAEGDFDKKEQEKPEEQEPEQPENEDEVSDGEGEREENSEEVPLDADSMPAEPEEQMGSEEESVNPEDQEEPAGGEESEEGDENSEELDSKYDEKDQQEQEDASMDGDSQEELDVQKDVNNTILEDDQIEDANQQDQKPQDQANLKRQQTEQQKRDQNPDNKNKDQDPNQSQAQADQSGSDLLFQFSKKIQQQQQQKQEKVDQQQSQERAKKQIDDPNMTAQEKREQVQEGPEEGEDEAMEYELDEHAQNTEGRLATDQAAAQEVQDQEQTPKDPDLQDEKQQQPNEGPAQKAEHTTAQAQAQSQNPAAAKENQPLLENPDEDVEMFDPWEEIDQIALYEKFLAGKKEDAMEVDKVESVDKAANSYLVELDKFDYLGQRNVIRQLFTEYMLDKDLRTQSLALLSMFKSQTQQVSASLCEQLRIVLEPQLSQHLQGDFKTGKRLNMKKVISFIASHYRNDKIWLRRTLPSKRDYKILIAIDDSLSMKENNLGFFSLEAMIALTEALQKLEVGKVAVARIRDRLELLQSFEEGYSSERAGFVVSQFSFEHHAKTSADHAMANFVSDTNSLLDSQNQGSSASCPFVIVLSDGRFNKDNVRKYIREAKDKRYLYIFVVLDQTQGSEKDTGGIMSLRSASRSATGQMKLTPYLSDFPFDYYCIVRNTKQLPNALGSILVQWFSMITK